MTKVSLFDHSGSDRHIAAYFWTSTSKDEDAFFCPETEVERVLRFGMKADPVPHATPFGHPHVTVKVDEVPLFVVAQWQRHRVQNYSQKSLRYTMAANGAYVPEIANVRGRVGRPGHYTTETLPVDTAIQVAHLIEDHNRTCFSRYHELLDLGVAEELARTVLPVGTLTRMYATASLRNWFGFLVQRTDAHTQVETREAAQQVEAVLTGLFPISMRLWCEYGRRVV